MEFLNIIYYFSTYILVIHKAKTAVDIKHINLSVTNSVCWNFVRWWILFLLPKRSRMKCQIDTNSVLIANFVQDLEQIWNVMWTNMLFPFHSTRCPVAIDQIFKSTLLVSRLFAPRPTTYGHMKFQYWFENFKRDTTTWCCWFNVQKLQINIEIS